MTQLALDWSRPYPTIDELQIAPRREGTPVRQRQPIEERFWSKVDRRGPDECWPWTACYSRNGYGWFGVNGKGWVATRMAWFLTHGSPPDGFVCHRCDNPQCVNPAHLFVGSHTDNMRDAVAKGRMHFRQGDRCKYGHLLAGDNIIHRSDHPGRTKCRQCHKVATARYRAKAAA